MTLAIIILAVAVLGVVGLLVAMPRVGVGNGRLQRRFGPEYDRTLAQHDGDAKAAKKELSDRLRRHGGLRERPLAADEREQYEIKWTRVQERFVDSPSAAVIEADHLLTRLVHDRGFPSDSHDDQVAALSVRHPRLVDGYRRVHALAGRGAAGGTNTEELRETVLRARDLFRELLTTGPERSGGHSAASDGNGRTRRLRVPGALRHAGTTTKGGV
ncbi:hypothetical protein [Streptomyces sp. NBC_01803]|uniref:hypothetical protein n=1 Tax=Streptomyces sp. NBC_01803 TaxID=2975946 RepID=UPI002DDC0A6F|nr:hypothetical protein [Streptomyces sp. NBC_01803]WSA43760.1 hypothetical protein OIE51_05815 [Streptomyces sp. NBC_01803]